MIPLIPYKRFFVNSSLTLNEAIEALSKTVTPRKKRWFQWSWFGGGNFEGVVAREGFTIERAISYRNSFLPILHGTFHPHVNGTKIEVVMKMHPLVIGFSIFWCLGVVSGMIGLLVQSIASREINTGVFITFGMLVFFYLMTTLSFGFEAQKATQFICGVFKVNEGDKL